MRVGRAEQVSENGFNSGSRKMACEDSPVRAFYFWTLSSLLALFASMVDYLFAFSFSESPAVGYVQHLFLQLTSPNAYVAKWLPALSSRPPSPKNSVLHRWPRVMHVSVTPDSWAWVQIYILMHDRIPKCNRHVRTYTHPENRSLIQSPTLMRLAIMRLAINFLLYHSSACVPKRHQPGGRAIVLYDYYYTCALHIYTTSVLKSCIWIGGLQWFPCCS